MTNEQTQMAVADPDTWSGKTSPEPSVPTKARTSGQSSKRQRKLQMKMPLFLNLRKANGHTPDVSWETDGQSLGEYMMPNFGEYLKEESGFVYSLTLKGKPQERYYLSCGERPNIEMPSKLSQILEQNPDPKYNLSEKACLGILRRAEKRGKVLPPMLDQALRRQAGLLVFKNEPENQGGGKGILIQNERTGALSTLNNQSVVYGISAYESNAMKSSNPNSGIYEADTSRTLDLNGGSPACNQGGMAVVCLEGNGSRPSHRGEGYAESETMYTLNAVEHHAVCTEPIPINTMVGTRTTDEKHTTFGVGNSGDPQFTLSSAHSHAVAVENHPADSRVKVSEDGVVQTLSGRMGTGGGNVPMVMEAIGLDNHNIQINEDVSETLRAESHGALPMVMEEPYNATTGSFMRAGNSGVAETLAARDYKDPQIVCNSVVRRLTPLECERLQGFPVVRKVRFTEMTKDEYIAWNISEGNIIVDTEYGKVFATRGPGGVKLDEPKELTGSILNGYRVVSIRNGETKMQCRVHRIVWIAEHGIIPDGYVVDHINNDKQDNRRCNLQLLTAAENSTKARKDGLYKVHGDAGSAKITDEVHDFIQYVYGNTDLSIRQLSEIFGISKSRVHQIIHDEPWTDIGDWVDSKGKKHKGEADSPRYKALGNSLALPFWNLLAGRICKQYNEQPTMGSLFSGIGGFELVFQNNGANPVWSSEVEEFAIAVTKKHFPEGED